MTYREQLNKVKELGVSVCDVEIADKLDSVLEFDYTEEEFESLCKFSKDIYLRKDAFWENESITANAIARCINNMVLEEDKPISKILETSKYDFVEKVSYYL